MNSIQELLPHEYPALLQQISGLPEKLSIRGELPDDTHIFLTIVGSRKHTAYGKEVVEMLVKSLSGFPVVIVSGLAHGIDILAHKAALAAGLRTIAIPGSGLSDNTLYPASNRTIAKQILESHGALISPFAHDMPAAPWMFPIRNRIMAGISHATLVIEAEIKSGTLITSKYATEFNRNVFAVPGSIFSVQSAGPHMLIRLGATPITTGQELIEALGFTFKEKQPSFDYKDASENELKLLAALETPQSRDQLIESLHMDISTLNALISLLEIKGAIIETMGEIRRI